jgi:hypothetical protein
MDYFNGCSIGKASALNEERRLQNQEKRQDKLDAIGGTFEEKDKFEKDLVHYFDNNKMQDAFHYIVKEEVVTYFLDACKFLNCRLSKYYCTCETRDDKRHRHMVIWIPNPTNVKKPSQKLSRMLSVVMRKNNATKGEHKRVSFGIKIKSRVHLLNVVLYIQTANTQGQHSGKVKECAHFDHRMQTIFPDRRTLQIYKEDELDFFLPEFAKERRESWQKKKKDQKLDENVEDFKKKNELEKCNEMVDD